VSRRLGIVLLVTMLVLAACGDEAGDDGTVESDGTETTVVSTTEAPVTTEDGGSPSVGLDDIPQQCIDAFVAYLQAIESVVDDVDWSEATVAELEELGSALEPATAELENATADSQCEDIEVDATNEESFEYMIELAQREAPGTVGYLEMIRGLGEGLGEGSSIAVTGDCESDIQTLQAIVDEGGTIEDLPIAESGAIAGLIASISANCSQERTAEVFSQEDITGFMGG